MLKYKVCEYNNTPFSWKHILTNPKLGAQFFCKYSLTLAPCLPQSKSLSESKSLFYCYNDQEPQVHQPYKPIDSNTSMANGFTELSTSIDDWSKLIMWRLRTQYKPNKNTALTFNNRIREQRKFFFQSNYKYLLSSTIVENKFLPKLYLLLSGIPYQLQTEEHTIRICTKRITTSNQE